MKVALICPGPSAERYPGTGYELVIGVNRAAVRFPCDVFAAGDFPLIEKIRDEIIGGPALYTCAATAARIRDHGRPWPGEVVEYESLSGVCDRIAMQWDLFTATAALVFAAHTGPTSIEVFGADWRGTDDWDGQQAGGNRSDARWELESRIWQNRLVPWLNARGTTVNRIV